MVNRRLKTHALDILLTTSQGQSYLGQEILQYTFLYSRMLSCISVSSTDTVGIHCKNEMHTIAMVFACMNYRANFTILDPNDLVADTVTKMTLANISTKGVLISEEVLVQGVLTIHPETFKTLHKGWNYYTLKDNEKKEINQIFKIIENLREETSEKFKNIKLPSIDLHCTITETFTCTVFHEGISKGIFNASKFKLQAVEKGIIDSITTTLIKDESIVVLAPLSTLYNLINGVIAPMLNGNHVYIGNNEDPMSIVDSIKTTKTTTIYISAIALIETLTFLSKEVTDLPILKNIKLYFLYKKMFGRFVKNVITFGKITNKKILNTWKKKYSILYVMNEIVSYVAKATYNHIPKKIWLTPRLNVSLSIEENENYYGEIKIISDDLFDRYLLEGNKAEHFKWNIPESLPKDIENKFRTEDIGLKRGNKVLIKDKTKHIFVNDNNIVIETGKILAITKRFHFVKTATIVVSDNKLLLIVEPDFDYLDINIKNINIWDTKQLANMLNDIKAIVNKKVRKHSQIHKIIWINNPEGLYRKNYKIISRYF